MVDGTSRSKEIMTFFSHVENAGGRKKGPWNAHCNSNVLKKKVEFKKKKKEKNLLTGTGIVGDGC